MKIGIDFGTSYCKVAVYHLGSQIRLMPTRIYAIPSLFYYDGTEILIGDYAAEEGQGLNAKDLVREVKMDLNSNFRVGGQVFTAKEIVGYILRFVKEVALEEARALELCGENEEPEGVILSVPANFSHNEKQIIKEAAEIPISKGGPGLRVLGLIKEPVAAALSYFEEPLTNGTRILVYDLGGGTCDIAIVEANDSLSEKYEVKATETIRRGGKDWDHELMEFIRDELEKLTGQPLAESPEYKEKIKAAAISVKEKLSGRENATARVVINGSSKAVSVTRQKFEGLTRFHLEETIAMTKQLLQAGYGDIDKIICVGGGSNMPQVKEGLKRAFPSMTIQMWKPEMAIAFGAAIYAANCDTNSFLQDVAAFSYGTNCYAPGSDIKHFTNVIFKGDKLPVTKESSFLTRYDNQNGANFDIFESTITERNYPYDPDKKPIIEMSLDLPYGYPKGTELVLQLTLGTDGLLTATASDENGHSITVHKQLVL